MNSIKKFINDEAGVTAIEYALLASLIAVAIIATVTALGAKISTVFSSITGKLTAAK